MSSQSIEAAPGQGTGSELSRFLHGELGANETAASLARRIQIPYGTVKSLLEDRHLPSQRVFTKLQMIFGERLPQRPRPSPKETPGLLTTAEATMLLGISTGAFRLLKKQGQISPCATSPSPVGDRYLQTEVETLRERRQAAVRTPKTELGRFLLTEQRTSGRTRLSLANDLGISITALNTIVFTEKIPRDQTLAKLRTLFGESLPLAPGEVPDTMTSAQAAATLGVSTFTLYELKRDGKIASVVAGHYGVKYRWSEVEALREERAQAGLPRETTTHAPRKIGECALISCGRAFKYQVSCPQNFCSIACRDLAIVGRAIPKTPLGQFLQREYRRSGLGLVAFCQRMPIKVETLISLIDGRTPTDRTMGKLRAVFGDAVPSVETANAVMAERVRARLEDRRTKGLEMIPGGHSLEARKKRASSLRERPSIHQQPDGRFLKRTAESIARAKVTSQSSQVDAARIDAMRQRNTSTQGRAISMLGLRLRRRNATPDDVTLRLWANEVAHKVQLPTPAVQALWKAARPELWPAIGRKRLNDRHAVIVALMQTCGINPTGRIPSRFWDAALDHLGTFNQDEAKAPSTVDSLRQWWIGYERSCAEHLPLRSGTVRKGAAGTK
jgi:hypothetical protein